MFHRTAAAAAVVALLGANAAQAQTRCLTPDEVHGMVAYVMPAVSAKVIARCRPVLAPSSALLTRGPQLLSEFRAGQSAAFPMARQAFTKFSDSGSAATERMFLAMPETMLKPMIEGVVEEKLGPQITSEACPDIESIFSTVQQLPASNFVDLFSRMLTMAARKDTQHPICPA